MANDSLTVEQKLVLDVCMSYVKNKNFTLINKDLTSINWESVIQFCRQNKVLLIFHKLINKYIPDSAKNIFSDAISCYNSERQATLQELENIINNAETRRIDIIYIKGFVLSATLYDNVFFRDWGDIDLLVREEDTEKTVDLMLDLGYNQTIFGSVNVPPKEIKKKIEGAKHELIFYKMVESESVWAEVKNSTSGLAKRFINYFIESAIPIKIQNYNIKTFDLNHTFLHLIGNTYNNTEYFKGVYDLNLRDYMDLLLFIKQNNEEVNWMQIRELTNKYEMTHKVYSVLYNTKELISELIPEDLLELFDVKKNQFDNNNKHGEVVKWNSSFIFRLFNKAERIKEFTTLFLKKNISSENPNYKNRIILNNSTESKSFTIPNINDAEYGVEYFISKEESQICISLLLNQKIFIEENHVILFDFFVCSNNDFIRKTIVYTHVDYPLDDWFYENPIKYTSEKVLTDAKNRSLIKIYFSEDEFKGDQSNILSYKTSLYKKNQFIELLGYEYGNNDFFWLEENFGVIEV